MENRFFALCTLHCYVKRRKTHPFAFSPNGSELTARQAGSKVVQPLSECSEAGNIYIVDLDMAAAGEPLDWSKLPAVGKPKSARNGRPRKPVRVALRGGQPAVLGGSGWKTIYTGIPIETDRGPVYVGVVPKEQILDSAACFHVLDRAKQMKCTPIIWNHWERLPTDSQRLATLMMRRAIECCNSTSSQIPFPSETTIVSGLAEIRNLYGTGHGKHGKHRGLSARHAKLAAGAAGTLAVFLFETHQNRP